MNVNREKVCELCEPEAIPADVLDQLFASKTNSFLDTKRESPEGKARIKAITLGIVMPAKSVVAMNDLRFSLFGVSDNYSSIEVKP